MNNVFCFPLWNGLLTGVRCETSVFWWFVKRFADTKYELKGILMENLFASTNYRKQRNKCIVLILSNFVFLLWERFFMKILNVARTTYREKRGNFLSHQFLCRRRISIFMKTIWMKNVCFFIVEDILEESLIFEFLYLSERRKTEEKQFFFEMLPGSRRFFLSFFTFFTASKQILIKGWNEIL